MDTLASHLLLQLFEATLFLESSDLFTWFINVHPLGGTVPVKLMVSRLNG